MLYVQLMNAPHGTLQGGTTVMETILQDITGLGIQNQRLKYMRAKQSNHCQAIYIYLACQRHKILHIEKKMVEDISKQLNDKFRKEETKG